MVDDLGVPSRWGRLRSRRLRQGVAAAGTAAAMLAASVGIASANAANPLNDSKGTGLISGTTETNPDGSIKVVTGTVKVDVGGTWNWGELSNSSPQRSCDSRFGVGWVVDWSGVSPSAAPQPSLQIGKKNGGLFFHVGTQMDGVDEFTSPCKQLDKDGFPQGPWAASHTYTAGQTIPKNLCVNMYDLHGKPGQLNNPAKELDPADNGDNSIQTNDFDPSTDAGYCFAPKLLNASKIVTAATNGTLGGTISDSATLSDTVGATGSITFTAYSDANCATKVFTSPPVPVNGNGVYGPVSFTPAAVGQYKWIASFTPTDNSNAPATGACGDAGETSTVGANPDLGIEKLGPAQVTLGDDITYSIKVTNTGSVPFNNATFTDELPADTTLVSLGMGCALNGTTITCSVGNLAVGATSNAVSITIHPTKVGTVKNTATVPPTPTPGDDTSTVTTIVVAPPPTITVQVDKTNNANGDNTFSKSEEAATAGAAVPYRAVITNTSTAPVAIATLTDTFPNQAATNVCTNLINTQIPAGQSVTCNFTAPAPAAGTSVVDRVDVKVTEVGKPANFAEANSTSTVTTKPVVQAAISVTIDKTNNANGDNTFSDVETAPAAGANVPYRAIIKNTSTVPIQLTAISDIFQGQANATPVCADKLGTLAAGASVACTFSGTAPAAGSSLVDIASVMAIEPGNPANSATDSDESTVNTAAVVPPTIKVEVTKTNDANKDTTFSKSETAATAGATFTYRAVIKNTSTVPVSIAAITDTIGAQVVNVCPNLVGSLIGAGLSVTCEFDGTAPPAGTSVIDVVSAKVTEVGNPNNFATDTDTSTVTTAPLAPPTIGVDVDKTVDANADGTFHDSEEGPVSGPVKYRAVVKNTSNVSVLLSQLTDSIAGQVTDLFTACPTLSGMTLTANQSVTCEFSGTAPSTSGSSVVDVVLGKVTEVGNPNNSATDSDAATVTTPPAVHGAISVDVVKTNDADGNGTFSKSEVATAAGANVPYRAVIKNTSSVPVTLVSLTDIFQGQVNATNVCGNLLNQTIAVNASVTCDFIGPAPAAGTSIVDIVEAKVTEVGNPGNGASDTDTSTVTTTPPTPPAISLTVDKTVDANGDNTFGDAEQGTAGGPVTYKAVITNTSAVPVTLSALTDTLPGQAAIAVCPNLVNQTIDPTKSVSCTFTGTAPAAGSSVVDTVSTTVHEVGNPGNSATKTDTATVTTPTPLVPVLSVKVEKTNDGNGDGTFSDSETTRGTTVNYRAVITNTSAVAVTIKTLTDVFPGQAATAVCPELVGQNLAAGASVTCNFTAPAPPRGTSLTDTVSTTVTEVNNPNNSTTGTDTSTVESSPAPVLAATVVKTSDANGDSNFTDDEIAGTPGAQVPYRAVITNTSPVAVVLTTLTDSIPDQPLADVCPNLIGTVLQPAQSVTCDFQRPAPAAGPSLVDTVAATLAEVDHPENTITVPGTATVTTVQVLPQVITRPPAAPPAVLPITGTNAFRTVALAFVAVLVGLMLVAVSYVPRRRSVAAMIRRRRE